MSKVKVDLFVFCIWLLTMIVYVGFSFLLILKIENPDLGYVSGVITISSSLVYAGLCQMALIIFNKNNRACDE